MLLLLLALACGDSAPTIDGGASDGGLRDTNPTYPDRGLPDGGPPPRGFSGAYYEDYLDLALERLDPAIDFRWADGAPDPALSVDRFSARWRGVLEPPASGTYRFATNNDDGVRVIVGGTVVIDDWRGHFPERHEGTIELEGARSVPIVVEYFEIDMTAELSLYWTIPGGTEEILGEAHVVADTSAPGDSPKPPFANPVVPFDCPDPGVLGYEGYYYMVCTGGRFPIRRSRDLVRWSDTGASVLPSGAPSWAANGFRNWAPEIHRVGDRFVVYYTSVNGADVLSIGAAYADDALGPYTDRGAPLVEHADGVIDANYFRDDDGRHYLFYKIDGNAHRRPTPIFVRELAPDGLSFADGSSQVRVLVNDPGTWEGGVVEASWTVRRGDTYYLFYSGNVYDSRYRTGVARASSVTGPYEKLGPPILTNDGRWVGPGHGSVVRVGDDDWFFYHAWNASGGGHDASRGRFGLLDRIAWTDGWPRIGDGTPTETAQRWPGD